MQGLNILIPIVDQIKYVQSLKENAIDIPSQSAITEGQWALIVSDVYANASFLPASFGYRWGGATCDALAQFGYYIFF